MRKKKEKDKNGFVYSTDPDFRFENSESKTVETLPPAAQKLRIRLETAHRGGKTVTLVTGFVGKETDLETLEKKLKNSCGTGGSSKDGDIIIQGDQRDKILQWLLKNGYGASALPAGAKQSRRL